MGEDPGTTLHCVRTPPVIPPLYLSPSTAPQVIANADAFGLLESYRTGLRSLIAEGWPYAIDNECFSNGGEVDEPQFFDALDRHAPYRDRCLFVVIPDVPYDAVSTLEQFHNYAYTLSEDGWKIALATQNGMRCDDLGIYSGSSYVEWDDFEALFIGGDNHHKLHGEADILIAEARRRGKWIHIGRVNSPTRMMRFQSADSWDGTTIRFEPAHATAIAATVREIRHMRHAGELWRSSCPS
ncbi:MAG: hypothetical protein ACP5JG_13325 [Anaerolineae bacterium]